MNAARTTQQNTNTNTAQKTASGFVSRKPALKKSTQSLKKAEDTFIPKSQPKIKQKATSAPDVKVVPLHQNNESLSTLKLKEQKNPIAKEQAKQEQPKVVKTNTNPHKDKAFQSAIRQISKTAKVQSAHKPVAEKVTEVDKASPLTEAEQKKKNDQKQHIATMDAVAEKSKAKPFKAANFKALLKENLTALEKDLPKNKDQAKTFKKNEPISKVKSNISNQVKNENQKLAGPMVSQAEQKQPPQSHLPTQKPEQLPSDKIGEKPKSIDGHKVVPKKKHDSEISMQAESDSLDSLMKKNEITETQLSKSNEPKFTDALSTKTQAQQQAQQAPKQYRTAENRILNGAKSSASQEAKDGMLSMHDQRHEAFTGVSTGQQDKTKANQEEQKAIYKKLEGIYNSTKEKVDKKLKALSSQVDTIFSTKAESAKKTFEKNVEKKLDDIYGWTTIDDKLFGEDTEAIEKAFAEEKAKFIATMDAVLDDISKLIARELNAAIKLIHDGKKETDNFFNSLTKEQQKLATEAKDQFMGQYDTLEQCIYDKEKELAQGLANAYKKSVDALRESFDAIKKEVSSSWIDVALDALKAVAEAILAIKQMFVNLLASVIEAVGAIISDPIGFLSNLISGVKQGFMNFFANIKKHLITGLVEWLTGSLGGIGIELPKNLFSLSGIFNLSMQILGLTWDYFRAKAVKLIGEPVVQALEKGFEMFKIIKEKGISGLWEYIKSSFNDLQETVMGAIKEMLITKVIEAGIKWIIGLMSPAGAFVKAAMLIIDVVKFFIERAAQIFELVKAFTQSIAAIAAGNVKAVAKYIELALAKAIPVLIGFLASLLGITGLTSKVQAIIKKIRKRIDKAIDKMILKAKKWGKKLLSKFKGKKNKKQKNKDIASGKLKDTEVGKVVNFKAGKAQHKIWIDTSGKGVDVMMASTPESIMETKLRRWKTKAEGIKDETQKSKVNGLIAEVSRITKQLDTDATKLEEIMLKAQKKPEDEKNLNEAKKKDDVVESDEEKLKRVIAELLEILGDDISDIPSKVKKHIGKRVVSIVGDKRFLAAFESDLDGTNYIPVTRDKGTDQVSFIIQRKAGAKDEGVPQLYIKKTEKDGKEENTLEIGSERAYKPTHKNYKPKNFYITQNADGQYVALYETMTYDEQEGPKIQVDIDFTQALSENENKRQTRKVAGQNLKFKPEGNVRGTTDSATAGFHNAHLIGDRFGGSGFNEALNIYPSSEIYNVGENYMLGKEDKIADILKTKGADFRYNFTASAKISEEKPGSKNLEALLKKEFAKDTKGKTEKIDDKLRIEIEDKMTRALRAEISKDIKEVPGQFLSVDYDVESKETGEKLFDKDIPEDKKYKELIEALGYQLTNEGKVTKAI